MRRRHLAGLVLAATAVGGCGGGSAPPASPAVRTAPDIAGFLRQPVATPSVCTTEDASTYQQRHSPWVGHVDISIYLRPGTPPARITRIGRQLRRASISDRVYFESRAEAFAEFKRLYTCWAQVPRSQIPASYRVMLTPTATIAQRNTLVALMLRQPGVDSASCDPALPCTDVVRSASAQPR
ncbi:MAG TPA: permease-like cell division protein FtsX [Mycobacteriales bacterium]|nr:permease-like cell division protein FtsX [Mycobacteriales bacterium]